MTDTLPTLAAPHRRSRSPWAALVAAIVLLVTAMNAVAQAPAAPSGAAPPPATDELEKLVGPIALYPDDLVAIILPASTNPLQIVQADRFLETRKKDPKAPVDEKWDEAVKSLLNYPEVVKKMSSDLDWTAALGEAVVADSGEVMAAVQAFRRKVNAVGNLKTDDKQKVSVQKEIIVIEQANPEVIYVPQYNPSTVVVYGGYSSWGYYPAPYPVYYYPYPPGAALATGLIWGAAIGAVWGGARYGVGWGGNDININRNTNINVGSGNTNVGGGNRPSQGGSSSQWKSNKQSGQVSSSVGKTQSNRVGDSRGGASNRAAGGASAGARDAGGANRPGAGAGTRDVGGGSASGSRDIGGSPSASTRDARGGYGGASASTAKRGGGSAFDGGSSAHSAQMDSSRGASSRSSMSGGGGSRGGGGGGRGGGRR